MEAITKCLAGGVAIAALASAAPAAAQYYPGYGSPYGYGMPGPVGGYGTPGPVGGYGYSPYGNGANSQAAVNQCVSAVQARLNGGGYGGYGYGYSPYGGYGSGGRVLGISRVEPGFAGGLRVRGVASSGRYGGYGYAQNAPVDLVWTCRTDYRGVIIGLDLRPAERNYGYNYAPPDDDYSQYGYVRY